MNLFWSQLLNVCLDLMCVRAGYPCGYLSFSPEYHNAHRLSVNANADLASEHLRTEVKSCCRILRSTCVGTRLVVFAVSFGHSHSIL